MKYFMCLLVSVLLCVVVTSALPQQFFPSPQGQEFPQQQRQRPGRPGQNPFLPTRQPNVDPTTGGTTTTAAPAATTASPQYLACLQACPTTSEYNPVCGSDNANYHNNARLLCANRCGRVVTATRMGTCSAL